MAKSKRREKGSQKAKTTGSKLKTATSQAASKAQGSVVTMDGKAPTAPSRKIRKDHAEILKPAREAQTSATKRGNKSSTLPSMSRRNALRAVVASVVVIGVGTVIHRHDVQARDLHDLSAIGEGVPAVVQIHDPSCPLCRRLMGATRKAIEDFPGIDYRVADITTNEGNTFRSKYNVPNVTLLLFDTEGRHIETLTGVHDADELRELFAQTFGDFAKRDAEPVS